MHLEERRVLAVCIRIGEKGRENRKREGKCRKDREKVRKRSGREKSIQSKEKRKKMLGKQERTVAMA